MRAHVRRDFTRGGGRGFHLVVCTTFDPAIHTVKTIRPNHTWAGWYCSYKFYARKATDGEVQADLDHFVTTLREHVHEHPEGS